MRAIGKNKYGYDLPLATILSKNLKDELNMRPFWAAYFNMARMNLFDTLRFISQSVGLKCKTKDRRGEWRDDDEQNIAGMEILSTTLLPEQEDSAQRLLTQHFPFLRYIDLDPEAIKSSDSYVVSFSRMRDILKNIGYTINFYRNYYSHSRYIEDRNDDIVRIGRLNEQKLGGFLQQSITVSARLLKDRYSSRDNYAQKGMLDDDSLKFITDGKVKFTRDEKGKRKIVPDESYFLS